VTITVTPSAVPNLAPSVANDSYSVEQGKALAVPAPGVLANDSDLDGDALTATRVAGPSHGTLTLNANGSFSYTPTDGYQGADSFTYRARDGKADSIVATVTITVTPPAVPKVYVPLVSR
jgi:VCBS repeat-containing protein